MKGKNKMKYCKNCGKLLTSEQRHNIYCSQNCQKDYEYKQYIQDWKDGKQTGLKGEYQLSNYIKRYLLEKHGYKCELCGWGEINPFTKIIPLEIHHIDSDHTNNNESNLQVLCPNCHSLTENFRSRGSGREERKKYYMTNTCIDCGKTITNTSIRCHDCEVKHRAQQFIDNLPISREELKKRIRVESFEAIGRDYNISGNGLKRWISKYNLPNTKTEIKKYTDEEWEQL